MAIAKLSLICLFSLATVIPSLVADIAEFDEVWKQRAGDALETTKMSYNPNPEAVTSLFNMKVHKSFDGNATRRNLMGHLRRKRAPTMHGGACMATNPIDSCWRCKSDWAQNRQRLADCALGFGHNTRGGQGGKIYVVTDNSDSDLTNPKPGTLRHAVIQKEPLWIIFDRSMNIKLSQELIMAGDKTIDGRGADVHITQGAGITIQFVKNIIIHGIHIHHVVPTKGGLIRDSIDHMGRRTASDGDGINIFGSSNIWLDHLSMSECADGLIDVISGSTAITISNSHFTKHDHVMLFGASDTCKDDKMMQVTVAFNHFGEGLTQRMPRCRFGFVHVVNNDYHRWQMYALGGGQGNTFLSQGNRFLASDNRATKEVTKRDAKYEEWKHWTWISEGDLFLNGAFFNQSGDTKIKQQFSQRQIIKAKTGESVPELTQFSGALNCKPGTPC